MRMYSGNDNNTSLLYQKERLFIRLNWIPSPNYACKRKEDIYGLRQPIRHIVKSY